MQDFEKPESLDPWFLHATIFDVVGTLYIDLRLMVGIVCINFVSSNTNIEWLDAESQIGLKVSTQVDRGNLLLLKRKAVI